MTSNLPNFSWLFSQSYSLSHLFKGLAGVLSRNVEAEIIVFDVCSKGSDALYMYMTVCFVKMQCNIISSRCSTARHKVWYYTSSHTFILKKNLQGKQSTNTISASADVERHGCKDGGFWILHTPPFLSGAL